MNAPQTMSAHSTVFQAPVDANRAIGAALDRFLSGGRIGDSMVRPEIATAWQRSFLHGVRPCADRAPSVSDTEQWCRHQGASEFGATAIEVLDHYDGMLAGTRSVLVLADSQGSIFHVAGDGQTRRQLERINFMPGGTWDEDHVGPNGVGTPLRLGHTDFVFGNEHYCTGWQPWTCIGSPIRDPDSGQILGVVDLTCPAEQARQELLVVVASIARNITQLIDSREAARRETLLREFHHRDARSRGEGLVLLSRKGRIVQLNDRAREILGSHASDPVGQTLISQLPTGLQRAFRNLRIDAQSAIELEVDDESVHALGLQPLRDAQRRLAGYLLSLRGHHRHADSPKPPILEFEGLPSPGPSSLRASTNDLIRRTLAECNGEVGRAARRLGIARSTLYRRMKQGGVQQETGDAS